MRKAIALALVLVASPAAAQDCFRPDRLVSDLREYAETKEVAARGYLWESTLPGVTLLIAWLADAPSTVAITSIRDGCAVLQKDGSPIAVRAISPGIRQAITKSILVYSSGGVSPFDIY